MKLWFLDTGSIVIDHAQLMWNVPGNPVRIPCHAVLIDHPDGLILFDAGFDYEHTQAVLPFELPEQTDEQTIPAQLELCGFKPADVKTLAMSHLHFDHVGGNKYLTESNVVVHAKEIAQARKHEPFEFYGYSDKTWDYDGAKLVPVTGDFELAKGLWFYETPGHTVGHYSLLVKPESDAKPMLLVFDVVYTGEALEKGIQPGFHNDPVAGVRSIQRVKDLAAEHGAGVYFSHDMEAWNAYKHAPDYYEV